MQIPIHTSDGDFVAHYSNRGLAGLDFPSSGREPAAAENGETLSPAQVRRWHALTTRALKDALAGKTIRTLPPLDLSCGTEFQQAVWNALLRIEPGKTRSYGEVAAELRKPGATRAVGGACGANPIPVLVPCHRVLAANQKLGGFSSGLDWKRKLLARERIEFF
jgi:O-6-methylguanine DNA methyltransferase